LHSESNAEFYAYLISTDTLRGSMKYYARPKWQVHYVGKTEQCVTEKNYHVVSYYWELVCGTWQTW